MRATSFVIAMLCWTSAALGDEPEPPPIDPCDDGLVLCDNPAAILRACWSGRTVCVGERVWDPAGGSGGFLPGYTASIDDALEPYIHNLQVVSVSPVFITASGVTSVTVNWKVLCTYRNGQPVYDYLTTGFAVHAEDYLREGLTRKSFDYVATDVKSKIVDLGVTIKDEDDTWPNLVGGDIGVGYEKSPTDLCAAQVRGKLTLENEWSIVGSAFAINGLLTTVTVGGVARTSFQGAVVLDERWGVTTDPDLGGGSIAVGLLEIPIENIPYMPQNPSISRGDTHTLRLNQTDWQDHAAGTDYNFLGGCDVKAPGSILILGPIGAGDISVSNRLKVTEGSFVWQKKP